MSTDGSSGNSQSGAAMEKDGASLLGWLSSLRSRFGLGGAQTLRDTLEHALREDDYAAGAFSAGTLSPESFPANMFGASSFGQARPETGQQGGRATR